MDVISRLLPPGGTIVPDILFTTFRAYYHFSLQFLKVFWIYSHLFEYVDILFDEDHEVLFSKSAIELRNYVLQHLKVISRSRHSGSIGITFFIHLMACVCTHGVAHPFPSSDIKEIENIFQDFRKDDYDFHESQFLHFLNYLNYHVNSEHPHLLNAVIHSIKMSSLDKPKPWYENINTHRYKNEKNMNKHVKQPISRELKSYFTDERQSRSEVKNKRKINLECQNKTSVKSQRENFEILQKSYHPRSRRYVLHEDETSMKLKVSFKLEKPAVDGNEEKFQRHFMSQLAKTMRIPISSIKDLEITQDTHVSFTISAFNDENNVMDDMSVKEAADSFKEKIRSQQLRLRDLNGEILTTAGKAYAYLDEPADYSLGILILLCIILLIVAVLVITVIYIARRTSNISRNSNRKNQAYKNLNFGRDLSQSIGKYSYDSGLWLGPGPEPNFTVPDAPYYRPPTVEQIASTPRPVTAVRTRLKTNWNVDERAFSTIPDNLGRNHTFSENPHQ